VYAVSGGGGGTFTANFTITNTGTTAINGWTLRFAFPGNQQVIQPGWSATWTQTGTQVTAANLSWNQVLNPGQGTQAGFNASYSGANAPPAAFTLNNATCS
jgi:endoglucanase